MVGKLPVVFAVLLAGLLLFGCVGSSTGAVSAGGSTKEFTMKASQFQFSPGTINVRQGDTVVLHITSTDVAHGIAIPDFGVSQELPPGQEETVTFVADKPGTFTFFCNVVCGSGHSQMRGQLIVSPT